MLESFFLQKYCLLQKCSIDWHTIWCYFRNWGQIPQNLGFHLWKYMSLCFRFRENGQSNNGKIETILWRLELKKERLRYFSSSHYKENLLDDACGILNLNKSDFSVAYTLLIICA